MSKIDIIEWYETSGNLGGQRGLTVDLSNNTITNHNGSIENIKKDNIDDVKWCIEMNINRIKNNIKEIIDKINQEQTKYTKIDGGYSISNPLTEDQKQKQSIILSKREDKLNQLITILKQYSNE